MNAAPGNFDGLARSYLWLERVAFGRDLERARFAWLSQLAGCRSIIVLGEGDGRCVARLAPLAPLARIHCVDASAVMLDRAKTRLAGSPDFHRVRFERADVLTYRFPRAAYDAAVTLFFLDCFDPTDAARIVHDVGRALTPEAAWLYADFAIPSRPLAAVRARLWLAALYTFFRWKTGIRTRELPPSEELIVDTGFRPVLARTSQAGLLRSVMFHRP